MLTRSTGPDLTVFHCDLNSLIIIQHVYLKDILDLSTQVFWIWVIIFSSIFSLYSSKHRTKRAKIKGGEN